ncbi:MAG: GNAT family N-acetyltransferase [Bowdeniella nasicola]|nr:GNAT family N-acetyltransferase [Bowdeniella nasicola]
MNFHLTTPTRPQELATIYRQLLEPSFPAHELSPFDEIVTAWQTGQMDIQVARCGDLDLGVAIASWFETSDIVLLTWLAVSDRARGTGIGSTLLPRAIAHWERVLQPQLIIGEVEDPRRAAFHPHFGDPSRRWAFYRRAGALLIDVDFTMPRIYPDAPDTPMLLISLGGSRHRNLTHQPQPADPTGALTTFFRHYIASSAEGNLTPLRPQMQALLTSLPAATLRRAPEFSPHTRQ